MPLCYKCHKNESDFSFSFLKTIGMKKAERFSLSMCHQCVKLAREQRLINAIIIASISVFGLIVAIIFWKDIIEEPILEIIFAFCIFLPLIGVSANINDFKKNDNELALDCIESYLSDLAALESQGSGEEVFYHYNK